MRKYFYFILMCCFVQLFQMAVAQNTAPGIVWQKTIGGSNAEVLTAMAIAPDKSILLCGYSNSDVSGNKSDASFGGNDYWIVKLNANGNVLWNKTFGGSDNDMASAIICASDGSYLVGGSSISDKSGSKTLNSFVSSYDYWVLKLDANGNIQWDRTLGGTYNDRLAGLAELPNGNYVIGGSSYSNKSGTKLIDDRGSWTKADYWTVILNTDGTEKSQQSFGGEGDDQLTCVSPGGSSDFYAAGYSYSPKGGGKTRKPLGNNDYYIIRSNINGQVKLERDFGSKLSDYLTCMQVLPDNSLILGGYSNSPRANTKTDKFYGVMDFWLLKLKPDGTKQWDKTFSGGSGDGIGGDYLMSVRQTKDKGFILGGYSNSKAGRNKTQKSKGGFDFWIVKTDSLGSVQWDKTIGGTGDDKLTAVYEVDSNEYVVAGTSSSPKSGDKTAGVIGGDNTTDYWVLHLGTIQSAPVAKSIAPLNTTKTVNSGYELELTPNPVKDVLTISYNVKAISNVDFVIYAANGKTVLQTTLTASGAKNMHSFNIAKLPNGSYFAVMYVDGTKITKAFTKE